MIQDCKGTQKITLLTSTTDCACVSAAPAQDATEVDCFGNKYWKIDGKLHREDGPAFIAPNGVKVWVQDNQLHRLDGPAVISEYGFKFYFIEGVGMSEDQFHSDPRVLEALASQA